MTDNEYEGMKFCSGCETWKPATAEYFNRDKERKSGLRSMCRGCVREYREKNKDKITKRDREYYQKNRGRIREYSCEYYQKNKDRRREYNQENKDRLCEYNREYHQKNKDKITERKREYSRSAVGLLAGSLRWIRCKTGATIYVRDMTNEQKETLANQYVAVRTLEKTEKELLSASGKKRCTRCDRILDYDCFHKNNDGYAGMNSICKDCISSQLRQYYQQKKQKST